MSDCTHNEREVRGVACDVTNCKYNTNDCECSAEHIKVENRCACTKGETYCGTFTQRGTC